MAQQVSVMEIDNNLLSIDSDDDNDNYKGFSEFLEKDTERKKHKVATEITGWGDDLLFEIDNKKNRQNKEKMKYIKYITKHSKLYNKEQLLLFDILDVRQIYGELKNENKLKFKNFFGFLFES